MCPITTLILVIHEPAALEGTQWLRRSGSVLDQFLGIGGTGVSAGTPFTCPSKAQGYAEDQVAIGFSAASSCYGITQFQVSLQHV